LAKNSVHQCWHVTKTPPAMPMNALTATNPALPLTSPVIAVGTAAAHRDAQDKTLAP
jgi:hypothetical protein